MTITATVAFTAVEERRDRFKQGPSGCFGYFNSLNYLSTSDNVSLPDIATTMDVIEFWPHTVSNMFSWNNVQTLEFVMDVMNGFKPWKDMFVLSSANGIQVNLRENPADKVFTGLMTCRDFLYGGRSSFAGLSTGLEGEARVEMSRIGLLLQIMGAGREMMGGVSFGHINAGAESSAVYIGDNTDALAIYAMLYASDEEVEDIWAQQPIGEGPNHNGYVRNGREEMNRIRRDRGGAYAREYQAMSHWLHAWSLDQSHKPASLLAKQGRLTVSQFKGRLRQRLSGLRDNTAIRNVVLELFEELKEMYQ